MNIIDPNQIKCIIFDYGFTLSPDYYFKIAPPEFPQWRDIIQEHIFGDSSITQPWMRGELTSYDIAAIISQYIPLEAPVILSFMKKGCEHLGFNQAVWDFAVSQRNARRKTALVTANMEVFTEVVIPAHQLDSIFDIILNTADYHEIRKELLWPIAFENLGNDIVYANSLLIEDGSVEPKKFRELGGYVYQYSTDTLFSEWLRTNWNNVHTKDN